MSNSKKFTYLATAFISGLLAGAVFEDQIKSLTVLTLFIITAPFLFFKKIRWPIILLLVFLSGGLYYLNSAERFAIVNYNLINKKLIIKGVVNNEPEITDKNQKLIIKTSAGQILIFTDIYPPYFIGDVLEIKGSLDLPGKIESFDYQKYLRGKGIKLTSYSPLVKKVGQDNNWYFKIMRFLFIQKNSWREMFNRGLKEPGAGLASAFLLGINKSIDPAWSDKFSILGISHAVAISGTHITLLAGILNIVFIFIGLNRRRAIWLTAGVLLGYVFLTGWQASAVRSFIMALIGIWALSTGRPSKILNSLMMAGILMLINNPFLIKDDISFQLSFLAIVAMIFLCPLFKDWSEPLTTKIKNGFARKIIGMALEIFSLTMACQIFSAPIIINAFGRLSLIAPIANFLLLWIFDLLMILLLGALFLSSLIYVGLNLWFWPAKELLNLLFWTSNILVKIPYAAVDISISPMVMAGYYVLLLLGLILINKLCHSRESGNPG